MCCVKWGLVGLYNVQRCPPEMSLFCKIDKIMFADSEKQGRKRYFMKLYYFGKCKENGPRSDPLLHRVGNISLKKFDIGRVLWKNYI